MLNSSLTQKCVKFPKTKAGPLYEVMLKARHIKDLIEKKSKIIYCIFEGNSL